MLPDNFPSKLGAWDPEQGWIPVEYTNCFQRQSISGVNRFLIATSGNTTALILSLLSYYTGPFRLAYLLVTPPDGYSQMKYEVEGLSQVEVESFLNTYKDFLEGDARHHIWIHGLNGTIIWDEHDWIYVYGNQESVGTYLVEHKFLDEMPTIPFPHLHNESSANNETMLELLKHFPWKPHNVSNLG